MLLALRSSYFDSLLRTSSWITRPGLSCLLQLNPTLLKKQTAPLSCVSCSLSPHLFVQRIPLMFLLVSMCSLSAVHKNCDEKPRACLQLEPQELLCWIKHWPVFAPRMDHWDVATPWTHHKFSFFIRPSPSVLLLLFPCPSHNFLYTQDTLMKLHAHVHHH